MTIDELIQSISPEIYQNLKQAVELGKWPDGARLDAEQRALSLQAVIAWELQHLPEEQRSGYIAAACKDRTSAADAEVPDSAVETLNVRWLQ